MEDYYTNGVQYDAIIPLHTSPETAACCTVPLGCLPRSQTLLWHPPALAATHKIYK